MRGLQIVCSPKRSTQEWPPTWCTKGSSITPFPGKGVPSACMRASRAGLILTPHRTAEREGPTSHGRQEARPLAGLPILGRFPVGSRGGATGRLLARSTGKNKELSQTGRTETKSSIPSLSLAGGQIIKPRPVGRAIPVFGCVW